jgi:hypothetical protein
MRNKSSTKNNWKKLIWDKIENKINEEKDRKRVMKKIRSKIKKNELKF